MSILQRLHKMQQSGKHCDVKLTTSTGDFVFSHACLLAAASPVLDKMIDREAENSEKVINISLPKPIDIGILKMLVDSIYTSHIVCNDAAECSNDRMVVTEETKTKLQEGASVLGLTLNHDKVRTKAKVQPLVETIVRKSSRGCRPTLKNWSRSTRQQKQLDEAQTKIRNDLSSLDNCDSTEETMDEENLATVQCKASFFTCELCGKVLKQRLTWQRHLEKCPKKNKKSCPKCKCTFFSQLKLDKHMQKHYQRTSCTICHKSFTSKYVMKLHRRTHSGSERFACDICGKKFPYKSSLTMHTIIHTGEKPYICSVCGKGFTQKVHAKQHESQHVGKKQFKCSVCDRRFAHKSGLARHISDFHQKSRPYVCETCGHSFPRKEKLIEHNRIHTGEKPYICSLCGVSYKSNRSLKNHKKSKHNLVVPDYQVGITKQNKQEINQLLAQIEEATSTAAMAIPQAAVYETVHSQYSAEDLDKQEQKLPPGSSSGLPQHQATAANTYMAISNTIPVATLGTHSVVSQMHPPYQIATIPVAQLDRKLLENLIPIQGQPLPALVLPSSHLPPTNAIQSAPGESPASHSSHAG